MSKENFERLILLGRSLKEDTKNRKHKFNENWVDNIIDFYKENKGRSLIHLSDISDNLFIRLNNEGSEVLSKLISSLHSKDANSIKSIKNYLKHKDRFISLKNLKKVIGESRINEIENCIKEIKTTKSGIGKSTKKPKFPINLNTEFGAILIGNFPDTAIKSGYFRSKDKELLDELEKYFSIYVGKVEPTIWRSHGYYNMHLSPLVKILYKLSGLKTNNKQIITNNGLPYWTYFSSGHFQRLLLRKLWDTEGSAPVNKKMCLGQSTVLNEINEDIPFYPRRKSFVKCKNKIKIFNAPPNLLVSIQLLLYKFEIISYIKPHRLYKKKNGAVVCDWHLLIIRYSNIKNFYDKVGFGLKRKQIKLKKCLESYTKYPEPRETRELELLNIMKAFNTFTIKDLEIHSKLCRGTLRNYLTRMKKDGKIEKIRNLPQTKSSFLYEYKLKEN